MLTPAPQTEPDRIDTDTRPLVVAEGLSKRYPVGSSGLRQNFLQAVNDVNLEVRQGHTFGLVGETGSGKSTTGRLILALEQPTAGRVLFDGHDLTTMPARELRKLRRQMQPVPQDPYSSLNGRMRIAEILAEPFLAHKAAAGAELRRQTAELLDLVGLPTESLNRYPHEFSGGQRQRLVIARAIALRPRFLVCDEPLSALDVSVQAQVINLLRHVQDELRLTYLFISHDLSVVRLLCDDVAVMYLGRLMEAAPRQALFERPAHPYTQALLGAVPIHDPTQRRTRVRVPVQGDPPSVMSPPPGCPFHPRCPLATERCQQERPAWRQLAPGHWAACHYAPVDAARPAAAPL